jgi:hypothetical protein
MRTTAAVLLAALCARAAAASPPGAPAGCTPAAPDAIAEAERKAGDADHRAQEAESIAVRSGNPGASARAARARAEATAAQQEVRRLRCEAADPGAQPSPPPLAPPPRGY